MKQNPVISVIIPNYNDAYYIRSFYSSVKEHMLEQKNYDYEIIYVDDGSSDDSIEILRGLDPSNPRFTVVELYKNYGQQRAFFVGMKRAKGDFVVFIDGDEQYPPATITQLVNAMGDEYEMASGFRKSRKDKWFARTTSKIGKYLINKVIGIQIKDFGSTKALSRSLADRICLNDNYYSDVYAAGLSLQPRLVEVETEHCERKVGDSRWSLAKRVRLYLDLYIRHGDEQFSLILNSGLVLLCGALGLFLFMFTWKYTIGHQDSLLTIFSYSALIGLVGFLLIGWAMIASLLLKIFKIHSLTSVGMIRREYKVDTNEDLAES